MNQTKKNGKLEKKNGTICLPCSTGTDIIPVFWLSRLVKASDHEFFSIIT